MSQANAVTAPISTTKNPKGLFKKLFAKPLDNKKQAALSQQIDHVKKVSNRTTTFLNHLVKDNQFMYKLTGQDVSSTLRDIETIKLKERLMLDTVNRSLSEISIHNFDEDISHVEKTCDEIINKYITSVKYLTRLVNEKHESSNKGSRGFHDYNYIELVADFDRRIGNRAQSKASCKNTLKLRIGDHFGYNLQLNIIGSFSDNSDFKSLQMDNESQRLDFFYPINYSMILKGNLFPDINFIKGHLLTSKTSTVSRIDSVDILNDLHEELENILPCTNILKNELTSSIKFIESTENFLTNSIGLYQKEGYFCTDELLSKIEYKISNLKMLLERQAERIDPSSLGSIADFSEVSHCNYISIHSIINQRFVSVLEKMEILKEIYTRESASTHAFNLDIMKRIL